ncbi:MAG: hypothetical protein SFU98_18975 [Leptospiraceae bacterium]|nr:hypothetical protein [Leptospiraceae bacterium]
MNPHGNSHDNFAEHHLYEIIDSEQNRVFKYGISGEPLLEDGSSARANKQIRFLNNAVGWFRYFARVLLASIQGRLNAEKIENKYILTYYETYGEYPKGNIKD